MFGDDAAGLEHALRVKICGITNAADALASIEAGADALGLNCYRGSRRFIEIDRAADWLLDLPTGTKRIAVLVNPTAEDALRVAGLPFIDGLQLHGSESEEFCATLIERGVRFAKALPANDSEQLAKASKFGTDTIVLDSGGLEMFGGSGKVFPWSIAKRFVEEHPALRVVLAGGLKPDNVAQAVAEARPFAVDVTTGVEASSGRKDHILLREFVAAARSV